MRRRVLTLLAMLLAPASAWASDGTQVTVAGFTADGGTFVFDQAGYEDPSTYPHAEAFAVDVATGRHVPGTPARIRLETEDANMDTLRNQALKQLRVHLGPMNRIVPRPVAGRVDRRLTSDMTDPEVHQACLARADPLVLPRPAGPATAVATLARGRAAVVLREADGTLRPLHVMPIDGGPLTHVAVLTAYVGPHDGLVVLLGVCQPAWEGPNWRYAVATARVP